MSRFRVICGSAILLVLVLMSIVGLTSSAAATSIKPPAPPPVHQAFQVDQSYVAGNPAIHPHLASNGSGPTFTQADVMAFFQKWGFFSGPLVSGAHLQFVTIQFVTAQQASQLMYGESVGRPDDALVCYVKVKGPFLLTYVHHPPVNGPVPTSAEYGDAVFDAVTGNLLVWGIYFS